MHHTTLHKHLCRQRQAPVHTFTQADKQDCSGMLSYSRSGIMHPFLTPPKTPFSLKMGFLSKISSSLSHSKKRYLKQMEFTKDEVFQKAFQTGSYLLFSEPHFQVQFLPPSCLYFSSTPLPPPHLLWLRKLLGLHRPAHALLENVNSWCYCL